MRGLFASRPGVVGVVYDADVLPMSLVLATPDGAVMWGLVEIMRGVLTGVDLAGAGAVAVNGTLGQKIHVVVAGGERPGLLRLHGLIFAGVCGPTVPPGPTGLSQLVEFYEAVRVATTGRTVVVACGGFLALTGVVTAFQARVVDTQAGVGEFTLTIPYMPRKLASPGKSPQRAAALAGAYR